MSVKKERKILYIGNFSFPFGNAAGKRVLGNGNLFKELSYNTIFIGMDKLENLSGNIKDTEKIYDGFKYYNIAHPERALDWLNYKETFNKVINFIKDEKLQKDLDAIVYYGSPRLSFFIFLLIKWCKKNNITIISDSVDWLTPDMGNTFSNIIKWADTTYQKAYLNKKVDGLITISSYLNKYYSNYGLKTVIIPPLSVESLPKIDKLLKNDTRINICYAGLPFRKNILIQNEETLKDRIDKTIILFSDLKQRCTNFIFNIYGFTKEEYLKVLPSQAKYINYLGANIVFHGYLDNQYVVKNIQEADFTILLRDVKKETMAGFPTKVSESLSYGTPVITTKTSDLEEYIHDGHNGFFLDLKNNEKTLTKLEKIIELNEKKILELKNTCIAENKFHFTHYENNMKQFLNSIFNLKNTSD